MEKIIKGNLNEEGKSTRGWIFGHFKDPETPFYSNDFEVRWINFKKGESKSKEQLGINEKARTLSILIRGKFFLTFPSLNKEVLLEKEGDYIFWDRQVPHNWTVKEDCLVLVIRWPSIPGDQK